MTAEARVEDDGTVITAIEAGPLPQSVSIRVGPVFQDGPDPAGRGVWIEYQEKHMAAVPSGPVLLPPAIWRALVEHVERKLSS